VGKIEIFEDLVSQDAKDAQKQASLAEERKAAQVELEKRIAAQKKASEEKVAKRVKEMGTELVPGEIPLAPPANVVPGEPFGDEHGIIVPADMHGRTAQELPGDMPVR